ncbi:MAG TPA: hypothetical protein VMS08_04770 [Candidatus Saccharimonadia bacterium]|nr:hypothetical protein [Candidatus Saccharimonadia bacterium]
MKYRLQSLTKYLLGSIALLAVFIPAIVLGNNQPPPDCSQILFGRCLNIDYFTGQWWGGANQNATVWPQNQGPYTDHNGINDTWAIPQNVDAGLPPTVAATNFVNFVHGYLFQNTDACPINDGPQPIGDFDEPCHDIRREVIGAAFLVNAMLDIPGTNYTNAPEGITAAQNKFQTWSKSVIAEDAAGKVEWDVPLVVPNGHPDSTSDGVAHGISIFTSSAELIEAIQFHSTHGTYVINRWCGNSDGFFGQIDVKDMNMQAGLGGAKDQFGNPVTKLTPGGTYSLYPSITNTGTDTSNQVYLELKRPSPFIQPAGEDGAAQPYGNGQGYTPTGNCQPGYPAVNVSGSPPDPGTCAGPHWWWSYNNIPAHSSVYNQTANFTLSASTPIGSTVCFQADVTHQTSDPTSFSVSAPLCYKVQSARYPSVVGTNSDIQAGGGACSQPQNTGQVIGTQGAKSYGQYVVSGQGFISNFGSNNSASSSTLTLGSNGDYGTICRPDLPSVAASHLTGPPDWTTRGPGTYNISNWGGLTYLNGNATITGTVNQKLTIVDLTGTLTISGNISLSHAVFNATSLPSLGIITANDVDILPNVNSVAAYIASDGTIHTCYSNIPLVPPVCDNVLTIDGFLMAHAISLERLGPLNATGSQKGEQIIMNSELYLNPPELFDAQSVDGDFYAGEGELQPLF